MAHYFRERGHGPDFDSITSGAHTPEFVDSAQVHQRLGFLDAVLQPVEAIEPARHDPGIFSVLLEKLLRVRNRTRLIQLERRHDVSYYSHDSLRFKSPLDECRQGVLHGPPGFERGQNRVQVDRRAAIDLIAQRIRESIQYCAAPAPYRGFADAARAYRRLRVRNVERRPLHVHGYVEDGGRLGV